MSATSRILTLVFTDLADSTALKTQRGDRAVAELIERHRALVRDLAGECGGRIIDWAGDGCFLTFESSSAAVVFALRLQRAHGDDAELPGVRTGMHLGEVSDDPGTPGERPARVEGLAVDLAARISGLARPGQVLLSDGVANSARVRMEDGLFPEAIGWRSHGLFRLKGFDEPVEIREAGLEGVAPFVAPAASEKATPAEARSVATVRRGAWVAGAIAVAVLVAAVLVWNTPQGTEPAPINSEAHAANARAGAMRTEFGDRPAIAVLPFDNRTADPEQAYFADGLTEDLITRLSAWRAFPVIAASSSFRYRGSDLDLAQVGGELGARYLVDGSVRRANDRIRVTARLIDAPTGLHVWADTQDRPIADLFTLQDEISSTIAASLVGDLTRAEGERARERGTEDLEAWSLFQLGMQHAHLFTLEGYGEAARFFERAIERDPRFATAWGQLALSRVMEIMLGATGPRDEMVATAFESARRALELDARDPVAHAALGGASLVAGDPQNGIDSSQRAVDLNPSMPEAWIWLGWANVLAGNPQAAIVASERARQLDPQGASMVWIYENLAVAKWELGEYEEGLALSRRLVAANPTYFTGYAFIAMNAGALGNADEASAAIAEGRRIRPDLSLDLIQGYFGVSRPDFDARRDAALREAGLE